MGRSSPSIGRSATIVAWCFGLLESQKASISDSVGPHRLKNRCRCDSGDSSWKKRRRASWSAGWVTRSVAPLPSRSTTRDAPNVHVFDLAQQLANQSASVRPVWGYTAPQCCGIPIRTSRLRRPR